MRGSWWRSFESKARFESKKTMDDVTRLIHDLRHKAPSVREQSAQALGEIRDVRAIQSLCEALNDEAWSVREKMPPEPDKDKLPIPADALDSSVTQPRGIVQWLRKRMRSSH
jgi:hypothetical protein